MIKGPKQMKFDSQFFVIKGWFLLLDKQGLLISSFIWFDLDRMISSLLDYTDYHKSLNAAILLIAYQCECASQSASLPAFLSFL